MPSPSACRHFLRPAGFLTFLAAVLATCLVTMLGACAPADPPADGPSGPSSASGPSEATDPPRHLVLVSLDTFRADHLRPGVTPRLAALAEESVVFDDVVTATPSTLATHTSLFTGLHPHHHGVASNGWMVPHEVETLAERLSAAGFHTAGFVGSFALLDRFDVDQGFAHWDQRFDQTVGVDAVDQSQRRADRVVDAALTHLESLAAPSQAARETERLFLFVHLFDAHYPYDPPPVGGVVEAPDLSWTAAERRRAERVDGESPEELAERYAREAAFVDAQLGRLFDRLGALGILDQALVVVTSDHGEALWQHGERWHATEVYQTTVHGVFFVRPPGGASGRRVEGAVGTVDVMPTVLAALGLEVPAGLDGEAFELLAAEGQGDHERRRFAQATGTHLDVPAEVASRPDVATWPNLVYPRAVRQGRWKLIQWPLEGEPGEDGRPREALFDLETDPGERHDLIDEPPPEADLPSLRRALETWARSADPLPSHFDRDFELDTRRQLCALGYVACPPEEQ